MFDEGASLAGAASLAAVMELDELAVAVGVVCGACAVGGVSSSNANGGVEMTRFCHLCKKGGPPSDLVEKEQSHL